MTNDTNSEDVTQIVPDPRDDIIRELCEALEPFAQEANDFDYLTNPADEGEPLFTTSIVTVGSLRVARAAIRRARGLE